MRTSTQKPKATQQTTSATSSKIPGRAHNRQSYGVNANFNLQYPIGNQLATPATAHFAHDFSLIPLHSLIRNPIQAKLKIGPPDDVYEQEADRVADQVVNMPTPVQGQFNATYSGEVPAIQQLCTRCSSQASMPPRNDEEELLQRKSYLKQATHGHDQAQQALHKVSDAGDPLPEQVRTYFEPRFGHDFSSIRIHDGSTADQAARLVNARAFTYGNHIVFSRGSFQPDSKSGQWLLAHELTHTIQQDLGRRNSIQQTGRGPRMTLGTTGQEIEDTIHAIELALSIADQRLTDTSIPQERLARIRSLSSRLRAILPQLRTARGTDGSGVVIPFDTDPAANEIIPGDASRSVEELYYPFSIGESISPSVAQPSSGAEPPLLQSKLIQGVSVSALTTPTIQRFCDPIICLGIIVLGGLLLSGCSTRSSGEIDATRRDQAQANFNSNNSHLTATKRAKIHAALSATVGNNLHLLISYYDYYSNNEIIEASGSRLRNWAANTYATTTPNDDTYVRPSILAAGFPNLTLGSLLIHEYTHTRHNINWGLMGPYEEGDSYGVEFFFAERNGDSRRMREIRDVMNNPTRLVQPSQVTALWELFCKSYGGMKVLYEIIDRGSTTHTSVPELSALTAVQARELSTELVARRRSSRSRRLTQIIDWVWTNKSRLGMQFLRCNF